MIELNLLYIMLGWLIIYVLGAGSKRLGLDIDPLLWVLSALAGISSFLYVLIGIVYLISPIVTI